MYTTLCLCKGFYTWFYLKIFEDFIHLFIIFIHKNIDSPTFIYVNSNYDSKRISNFHSLAICNNIKDIVNSGVITFYIKCNLCKNGYYYNNGSICEQCGKDYFNHIEYTLIKNKYII